MICVSPICAQRSTNTLPPLAPAYPEMPPTFWEQHGTAVLLGSLVFLALAGLALWQIFKPKPPPVVPPEIVARQALQKLQQWTEDGNVLSEVSQILRRYFLAAFKLPAGEFTTAEFYSTLAGAKEIHFDIGDAVSRFLRECDERKFSPATATAPLQAASRALEFVELAERHRARSPSVPGAATVTSPTAAANSQTSSKSDLAASGDGRIR